MTARARGATPVHRVRQAHVEWVRERLAGRDWQIIDSVDRLRLATSVQLERLHFYDLVPSARDRIRRRVLARLVSWRVLMTLERRIGGVRAGSSGLVFMLDSAGLQLVKEKEATTTNKNENRRPREPSEVLLGHRLTGSELCVSLIELSRVQGFVVADYQTEPRCWWPNSAGGWLKPDVYVKLAADRYDDHWWIEVDKGTEHQPVIRRKLLTYVDYINGGGLGPDGTVPRVLVTVPDEKRRDQMRSVLEHLPTSARPRLYVARETRAADFLYEKLQE